MAISTGNQHFDRLVNSNKPVGEVISVDKFLVRVSGLQPCRIHSLVMFEDGSKGFVKEIGENYVLVLHMGSEYLRVGMVAVLQHDELVTKVGVDLIGRVIAVNGDPLDGKGPIAADSVRAVFNEAPPIHERKLLDTQLETGVIAIDALFPVVRGQRMALLGDSKSGKSTLATQMVINQKNTDQIVVYCLIAKRRSDIDELISRLEASGSMSKAIVVVSTISDSLVMSYIAPYVACAIAEYLWIEKSQDTIVIYDDLSSHAYAYREIALLSGVSPGRDSYPGDMFYAHSSLLERAGRLNSNGAHLTSIPIVNAMSGDITAYLPTNIMSITDGQWILDMDIFRDGVRPAINMGLSVTRVGGVGQSPRQKKQAVETLKILADYRQSEEFSHFGSELALEARQTLDTGKRIFKLLTQKPTEVFSIIAQELMLDVVLSPSGSGQVDIVQLKLNAPEIAENINDDETYMKSLEELKFKSQVQLKGISGEDEPEDGKEDKQPASRNDGDQESSESSDA